MSVKQNPSFRFVLRFYKQSGRAPYGRRKGIQGNARERLSWYPESYEECSCCLKVRKPDKAHPDTLFDHCFTSQHIRHLIKEHPLTLSENVPEALKITESTAPLYMDTDNALFLFVRDSWFGLFRESKGPN